METFTRDEIINELKQNFKAYIEHHDIDDIGIFEEEGSGENYYMGYTVNKEGKTYHIHTPYQKNNHGGLTPVHKEWTVESDEPTKADKKGYHDLESVFRDL